MPIYEYTCNECGYEYEVLQKIDDTPPETCPSCGEPSLVKKVTAAAFRLKGSGWYETDFKSTDKKNVTQSENKTPTEEKEDSTTKPTTSPDTKAKQSADKD